MTLNWKLSLLVILSGLGAGGGAELLLSSQAVMAQTNAVPVETNSSEESPDPDTSPILSVRDRLDDTSNTLDDGSYYDAHTFEGEAGQTIVIEMISEEFDTYLILRDPEGKRIAENDDGDGTNARIEIELPATGTYTIWANSYETGEIGEYSLSVQEGTSLDLLQQALDDAQERGDRAAERDALNDIAGWYDDREQYLEAADYYLQGVDVALVLLDEAEGEEAIAEANDNVAFGYSMASWMYRWHGYALQDQEKFDESLEIINQSLELAQLRLTYALSSNDMRQVALSYSQIATANHALGEVYYQTSQYEEAIAFTEKSLEILAQIRLDSLSPDNQQSIRQNIHNSLVLLSSNLYWLSLRYQQEKNYEKELELREKSLAVTEAAVELSQTQLELELTPEQQDIWEESRYYSIRDLWNDLIGISGIFRAIGEQYLEQEDYKQALHSQEKSLAKLESALTLSESMLESDLPPDWHTEWEEIRQSSLEGLTTTYSAIAGIYEAQYDYEKSLEVYQKRLEIAQQQSNTDILFSALTSVYSTYGRLGKHLEALSIGQQMLELSKEINNKRMILQSNLFLGATYDSIGRFPEAIDSYQEALEIARNEEFLTDELILLNNLGYVYLIQGEYDQAFDVHNLVLQMSRDYQNALSSSRSLDEVNAYCGTLDLIQETSSFLNTNDSDDEKLILSRQQLTQDFFESSQQGCLELLINFEASTLNNIASVYLNQGQYQEAIKFYESARNLSEQLADLDSVANILNGLGNVYSKQGNYNAALEFYQESLTIWEDINNSSGVMIGFSNLGWINLKRGNYEQAIMYFQQALGIAQETNLLPDQPVVLGNIGTVYYYQGDYEQATYFQQEALTLSRQMDLLEDEAIHLNQLAAIAFIKGEYEKADGYMQQVLAASEQMNALPNKAASLNVLGEIYRAQGRYAEAITAQEEALRIAQSIEDLGLKASVSFALGNTYIALGQYEQALNLQENALAIHQEAGDRSSTASTLNTIGEIYLAQGDLEQAFQKFEQAFTIREDIGELAGQSSTLRNIGFAYEQQQDYTAAKDAFEEALSIQHDIGARGSEGITLNGLALAQLGLDDPDAAIESLQQALALHQELGDRPGQAKALSDLGKAYFQANQLSEAETILYEALELLETLRASELKDTDKVALFDTQLQAYETLQQVLIAQNNPTKTLAALEIAERGRARAFVESLTIRLTDQPQLDTRVESPDLANIRQIAQQQNATLVNYSIVRTNPDTLQLYIWVIQPTGEISFKSVDLSTLDQSFTELITISRSAIGVRGRDNASIVVALSPEEQQRQQAEQKQTLEQLYDILIAPVVSKLPTNDTDRVIFIPQGDLFLVPFAALIDGNDQYLIENHTISIAPSIQTLELTHQLGDSTTPFTTNPLIVGNPDMPQVWNPNLDVAEKLPYLEGAEKEAVAIAQLLNIEPLLQNNATETVVIEQMQTASLIHLATHGLLEYGTPEESGLRDLPGAIALAPDSVNDGLLTSAEIYDMQLNAELVVLSACDTGRGNITGDGVIGLSRSFMQAGVPSVVVSLWSIPDDSTEFLMTQFYRNLSEMDKAQALRQAMLTTMQNQEYFSPLDWAAFTLIGEAE